MQTQLKFDKLPPNVQQLLFKLTENDSAAWYVASAITRNFNKFPYNIWEQLLIKLADNQPNTEIVSSVVEDYRINLPDDVRKKILDKLEEKTTTR